MHPILFKIGDFPVYTYGPLMALGFLLGFGLLYHIAKRREEDLEFYMDLYLIIIIAGLLGAKMLYNFLEWDKFVEHPLKMMNCRGGGLVWYGGVILGIVGVMIYARMKRVPVLQVIDTLAAPGALGLAIGRIGCLMGGCCYGQICDLAWGIRYPAGTLPLEEMAKAQGLVVPEGADLNQLFKVHPSPIYESLAALLIALVIYFLIRRNVRTGAATALWFTLYPVVRFLLEFIRGDKARGFFYEGESFNLSTSQLISLLIVGVAAILWVYIFTHPPIKIVTAADLAPPEPAKPKPREGGKKSKAKAKTGKSKAEKPKAEKPAPAEKDAKPEPKKDET